MSESDLRAQRVRLTSGSDTSLDVTVGRYDGADPNAIVIEPTGSLIIADGPSLWQNTGGRNWQQVGTRPSGTNLGNGVGVLSGTVDNDLRFNGLAQTWTPVGQITGSITRTADTLVINTDVSGLSGTINARFATFSSSISGTNLGNGVGFYSGSSGNTSTYKSFAATYAPTGQLTGTVTGLSDRVVLNIDVSALSGTIDARFATFSGTDVAALSGTIDSAIKSLSGTINARFANFSGGGGGGGAGLYSLLMTAPPTQAGTGFSSWSNQPAGSTVADTASGIVVTTPDQGVSDDLAVLNIPVPSAPYTIKALILHQSKLDVNAPALLGWADGTSASAKATVLQLNPHWGKVEISNFNTMTSHNAVVYVEPLFGNIWWIQLRDDGTNVYIDLSTSGEDSTFVNLLTVTKSSGFLGGSGYSHIVFGASGHSGESKVCLASWSVNGVPAPASGGSGHVPGVATISSSLSTASVDATVEGNIDYFVCTDSNSWPINNGYARVHGKNGGPFWISDGFQAEFAGATGWNPGTSNYGRTITTTKDSSALGDVNTANGYGNYITGAASDGLNAGCSVRVPMTGKLMTLRAYLYTWTSDITCKVTFKDGTAFSGTHIGGANQEDPLKFDVNLSGSIGDEARVRFYISNIYNDGTNSIAFRFQGFTLSGNL